MCALVGCTWDFGRRMLEEAQVYNDFFFKHSEGNSQEIVVYAI